MLCAALELYIQKLFTHTHGLQCTRKASKSVSSILQVKVNHVNCFWCYIYFNIFCIVNHFHFDYYICRADDIHLSFIFSGLLLA